MGTATDLKAELGTSFPTLETVAVRFLGLTDKKDIYRKHAQGKIPFPAFRAINSNKAPLLVKVDDLANYLDQQAIIAKER